MPAGEIFWKDDTMEVAVLYKKSGETVEISVGSLITYQGRPDGVKITGFTSKTADRRGPIGLIYLPWRGDRWATPVWTLSGNPRHLITYPVGSPHFGEHINWETVELLEGDPFLQIRMFELKA
jgi:hypothetical protein